MSDIFTCPEGTATCQRIRHEWSLQGWKQTWRRNWIFSTCTAAPTVSNNTVL